MCFVEIGDLVAVGHPNLGMFGDGVEDVVGVAVGFDGELCSAVFAVGCFMERCAQQVAGELHAIADAQDGDAEFEDFGVHGGGVVVGDGGRAAGEDDAFGVHFVEFVGGDGRGEKDREDAGVSDASADELGGLGPEVQNGDDLVLDV